MLLFIVQVELTFNVLLLFIVLTCNALLLLLAQDNYFRLTCDALYIIIIILIMFIILGLRRWPDTNRANSAIRWRATVANSNHQKIEINILNLCCVNFPQGAVIFMPRPHSTFWRMAGPVKSMSWSTTTLEMKLRDLNATMQSIQSVSQWLIHHRKHARTVVGIWFREMQKG